MSIKVFKLALKFLHHCRDLSHNGSHASHMISNGHGYLLQVHALHHLIQPINDTTQVLCQLKMKTRSHDTSLQ